MNSTLYASARGTFNDTNPLANITILGVAQAVTNVTFNGAVLYGGWIYNETSKVLDVRNLGNPTIKGAWSSHWVLKWT
jgi:alpha-glucosidase